MDTVSNLAPVRPETKPTGRHPGNALSAIFLRSASPGRHPDGNGLCLFLQPSRTRSWIQRLVVRGRRRELGLGSHALVPLAAARWSEVRWAEWEEIDRDAGVWAAPARRMKASRRHRVPLCGRALEILEAARTLGRGAGPLVFTRGQGKPLNDKELRWLARERGIAAVPHGFRSSFRDWAAEETDHPREVGESSPLAPHHSHRSLLPLP
ncbi:MAG: integrase family protein [Acidobacteriota bacterium]|nr:integrase family protein [Acidobacteriota bacterium]